MGRQGTSGGGAGGFVSGARSLLESKTFPVDPNISPPFAADRRAAAWGAESKQAGKRPESRGLSASPRDVIRIAIADENPVFRDSLLNLVSLEPDFQVVAEARDRSEVQKILENPVADILLLSLDTPGIDGIFPIGEVPEHEAETRLILLATSDDVSTYVHTIRLRGSAVVFKENVEDGLVEAIRKVHGGAFRRNLATHSGVIQRSGRRANQGQEASKKLPLSPRENEVANLIARGLRYKEIAEKLGLSHHTIRNHMHHVLGKLGMSNRLEVALYTAYQSTMKSKRRAPPAKGTGVRNPT